MVRTPVRPEVSLETRLLVALISAAWILAPSSLWFDFWIPLAAFLWVWDRGRGNFSKSAAVGAGALVFAVVNRFVWKQWIWQYRNRDGLSFVEIFVPMAPAVAAVIIYRLIHRLAVKSRPAVNVQD